MGEHEVIILFLSGIVDIWVYGFCITSMQKHYGLACAGLKCAMAIPDNGLWFLQLLNTKLLDKLNLAQLESLPRIIQKTASFYSRLRVIMKCKQPTKNEQNKITFSDATWPC